MAHEPKIRENVCLPGALNNDLLFLTVLCVGRPGISSAGLIKLNCYLLTACLGPGSTMAFYSSVWQLVRGCRLSMFIPPVPDLHSPRRVGWTISQQGGLGFLRRKEQKCRASQGFVSGTHTVAFSSYCAVQSKLWGQSRFKRWKNKHFSIGKQEHQVTKRPGHNWCVSLGGDHY